jgi:hypothetical protein
MGEGLGVHALGAGERERGAGAAAAAQRTVHRRGISDHDVSGLEYQLRPP